MKKELPTYPPFSEMINTIWVLKQGQLWSVHVQEEHFYKLNTLRFIWE